MFIKIFLKRGGGGGGGQLQCFGTTLMELLCMCLERLCQSVSVRGLCLNPPKTPYLRQVVVKVGNVFFSASVIVCLHLLCIPRACMS